MLYIYSLNVYGLCFRKNISYASMCNSAGQAFGIFLGYGFLMMLLSKTFWNNLRSTPQPDGVVSLQGTII